MMSLSGLCLLTGTVNLALFLPLLFVPGLAQRVIRAFPRNAWVGAVLAAVAVAWAAWEVNDMPLGFVDAYKTWLWVLGPVVYGLVMLFMNELLASRALGGLLMLSASPVLETQRLHDSPWTVVPAVLAYAWVVAGMVLMLSPYRFRHAAEFCCSTRGGCRFTGLVGVVTGGVLVALALTSFR